MFIGRTDAEAETPILWATSCDELTHWKRPWCWEGLGAGGEGNDRGWDGWMASPTQWTWIWVKSWSWWWTGRPGVLRFMGSQRVGHDWATELNWTEFKLSFLLCNHQFHAKCFMLLRLRNVEGKKKCLSFLPPWEFQTPIFASRVPCLFLGDPGLLISFPRHCLSQQGNS